MSERPPWSDPPCYPTDRFVVQEGFWIEAEHLAFGRARLIHTDGVNIETFW